ncbi:MAG TPA: hypothetical protein VFZ21_09615 [Gemmatimonadaceae bacterium]|nr:hypothetical protein [Gemmatimonadaceae bacterium]
MGTRDVRPEALPREHPPVSDLKQWVSFLGGPFAVLLNLEVSYAIVDWACLSANDWSLHLVHFVSLVLAVASAWLGRSLWKATGDAWPDSGPGSTSRSRFLVAMGALGGLLFPLVILAQWVTVVVLGPCRRA